MSSTNKLFSKLGPIDPYYSVDHINPDPSGWSLFAGEVGGACWFYGPSVLEAWLFNRLRHDSSNACINVFHPGRFPMVSSVLYVAGEIDLDALPSNFHVRFAACGHLHVRINNKLILHQALSLGAPKLIELDILPHLVVGRNHVKIRVNSIGEPPTMLVDEPLTKYNWKVSLDDVQFVAPTVLPFVSCDRFPHQERLPEVELTPIQIETGPEHGLYDFGVQVYGRPEITVEGNGSLWFFPGESLSEAKNDDAEYREQVVAEISVTSGQIVSPVELTFRYLRIKTSPGVKVKDLKLISSTYPVQYRGSFSCSDPKLDRIWWHGAHTLRLCMREVFLDGIKRDRLPWVGDLYLAGLANSFSFFDAGIIRRSLLCLFGSEPEQVDFSGIIDYSFFWILALRDYVLHFGDLDFLTQCRPQLQRLLNALEAKRDKEGLIPTEACRWLFIDWADVAKEGYSSCLEFLSIQAVDAAADCFAYIGDETACSSLREKVAIRRIAATERFWSEVDGAFRDCTGRENISRHANFLAVLASVPSAEQRDRLVKSVLCNSAVPAVGTPYMRSLEAAALARCGNTKAMLEGLKKYWDGMIEAGASSFWEGYEADHSGDEHLKFYGRPFGKSLCHAWSAGPLFLLNRELFGLQALTPGWATFTLHPQPLSLENAEVSIPTPHGPIFVKWQDQKFTLTFPAGTSLIYDEVTTKGPAVMIIGSV